MTSVISLLFQSAAVCLLLGATCARSAAGASLQCQVTYAGTTQTVAADPVIDPYPVPSVDIGGRFRFKPVVVGTAAQTERVLIYAYEMASDQARLIHQAKYLPPFHTGNMTGQHYLYAGPLERELSYTCEWVGGLP